MSVGSMSQALQARRTARPLPPSSPQTAPPNQPTSAQPVRRPRPRPRPEHPTLPNITTRPTLSNITTNPSSSSHGVPPIPTSISQIPLGPHAHLPRLPTPPPRPTDLDVSQRASEDVWQRGWGPGGERLYPDRADRVEVDGDLGNGSWFRGGAGGGGGTRAGTERGTEARTGIGNGFGTGSETGSETGLGTGLGAGSGAGRREAAVLIGNRRGEWMTPEEVEWLIREENLMVQRAEGW